MIDWPCTLRARGRVLLYKSAAHPVGRALDRVQQLENSTKSGGPPAPTSGFTEASVGFFVAGAVCTLVFAVWDAYVMYPSWVACAGVLVAIVGGVFVAAEVESGFHKSFFPGGGWKAAEAAQTLVGIGSFVAAAGGCVPLGLAVRAFLWPWWACR